jgi:hypothetical protein
MLAQHLDELDFAICCAILSSSRTMIPSTAIPWFAELVSRAPESLPREKYNSALVEVVDGFYSAVRDVVEYRSICDRLEERWLA